VRYIQPFKKEESCKLIEDLQIPKKFSVSADTVHEEITGGVPRQIVNLSQAEDLDNWRREQVKTYYKLTEKTFSDMSTEKQKSFISFLDQLFGPSLNVGTPPSIWYDQGLFYIEKGSTRFLNPLSQAAVFSLWAQHLQREIIDKPGRTGSEIGAVLEREVIKGFIHHPKIELQPFSIGPSRSKIAPGLLKISRIERIIYFDTENEIPRLATLECCLLKPRSQIYRAWDFIIEDTHTKQIVFVQTSTLLPNVRKSLKIEKAFRELDKEGHNQIERVLDSLFQMKGSKAHTEGGSFIITLPLEGWTVKFLYITSQRDDAVKQCSWEWEDLLVAGRETLVSLQLCFT